MPILPEGTISPITIEGIANIGTVLAIDNIEILEIIEDNPANISALSELISEKASYYTINGIKLQQPQKGINIIKDNNGRTYKVFIK